MSAWSLVFVAFVADGRRHEAVYVEHVPAPVTERFCSSINNDIVATISKNTIMKGIYNNINLSHNKITKGTYHKKMDLYGSSNSPKEINSTNIGLDNRYRLYLKFMKIASFNGFYFFVLYRLKIKDPK